MRIGGRRGGFTLPELILITLLTAIVLGGMTTTLMRQQRFYRGTADIIETRSQMRQAAGIIPTDLRGISSIGGDLTTLTDTSMVFKATIGSAIMCGPAGASNTITVPPLVLSSGNTLTSWSSAPAAGDSVFIYDDGAQQGSTDDQWRSYAIAEAVTPLIGGCPNSSGLTQAADNTQQSYTFRTDRAISGTIVSGAPMRFLRATKYSLYRATDGKWYLGYCAPAPCAGAPQPIAGPFLPYSSGSSTGVSFTYLNAAGVVTAVPTQVAQVSILVRAQTNTPGKMPGFTSSVVGDSLRFTVAIRNR